ncbi:MAG: hypothetical protein ACXU8A_00110 [Burkholderiaceae bacterium]
MKTVNAIIDGHEMELPEHLMASDQVIDGRIAAPIYGVGYTQRSEDGFNFEFINPKLTIGFKRDVLDRNRRDCDYDELQLAARKLNAHDDLVGALKEVLATVRATNKLPDTIAGAEKQLDRIRAASERANAALAKAGAA